MMKSKKKVIRMLVTEDEEVIGPFLDEVFHCPKLTSNDTED